MKTKKKTVRTVKDKDVIALEKDFRSFKEGTFIAAFIAFFVASVLSFSMLDIAENAHRVAREAGGRAFSLSYDVEDINKKIKKIEDFENKRSVNIVACGKLAQMLGDTFSVDYDGNLKARCHIGGKTYQMSVVRDFNR